MVRVHLPQEEINKFCKKWKIKEMSVFGSAIRPDFRQDSDVDLLVSFFEDEHWDSFDLVTMKDELNDIFKRKIDLVEKNCIRNPIRRKHILNNYEVIYDAARA